MPTPAPLSLDASTAIFVLRGVADFLETHKPSKVLAAEFSMDGLSIVIPVADFLRIFPNRHTRYPQNGGFRFVMLLDCGSVCALETEIEAKARLALAAA